MNNVLFTITNLDIIPKLREKGIVKMVFPLSFFCVGIPKTFELSEITYEESYLFVNRILDSNGINELKKILLNLPHNIKGIIFDDIGIAQALKDIKIEKILYNTHFATNYESVNFLFDYVDEVIISYDITEEEIDEIIKKTKKRVSIFAFGLTPIMYSRRTLIKNYNLHLGIDREEMIKNLYINDKKFVGIENDYGMMMYSYPYYNGLRLKNKDIKYLFYFPILLEDEQVLDLVDDNLSKIDTSIGFLEQKTIYKVRR